MGQTNVGADAFVRPAGASETGCRDNWPLKFSVQDSTSAEIFQPILRGHILCTYCDQ
jgi:hypothetical protein